MCSIPADAARGARAIPLLLLLGVLLLVGTQWFPGSSPQPSRDLPAGPLPDTAATVELRLDFGADRPPEDVAIPFRPATELPTPTGVRQVMTVGDLLRAASRDDDRFRFTQVGEADQSLLTSLGGVVNEGGGPTARNWMFYVDGQRADRSFNTFSLEAGDTVLWRFETYR